MSKIYFDIFGNPIVNCATADEELEEHYGETIDFLSEADADE